MTKQHGARAGNDKMMRVLISSRDYDILEQLAKRHNTSVSELVRRQLRQAIQAASGFLEPVA